MSRWSLIAVLLVLACAVSGCSDMRSRPAVAEDVVVMTVNGEPIYQREIDVELAYLKTWRSDKEDVLIDEIVGRQLIPIAAMKVLFADKLEAMKSDIDSMRADIAGGSDFGEVAKARSECPSAPEGGALGEFNRSMMVEPFGRHCFTAEPNAVSETFLTVYGWHVVQVTRGVKQNEEGKDTVEARHALKIFTDGAIIRKVIATECLYADIDVLVPYYARSAKYCREFWSEKLQKIFDKEKSDREAAKNS